MKRYSMLIAAGLLAGCHTDLPTGGPSAPVPLVGRQAENTRIAIDDVLVRVVPTLENGAGLASSLSRLSIAIREGRQDALDLWREAREAVERYAIADGANPVELDAIRLAVSLTRQ